MTKSIDSDLLVKIVIQSRAWYDVMRQLSGKLTFEQVDSYTDGIVGVLAVMEYDMDEACKLGAGLMSAMLEKQKDEDGKETGTLYDSWLKEG